ERIYITGAKGMLGKAAAPVFAERYDVFPPDFHEADVRDAGAIAEEIRRAKPKFVLHLAAMTDVDGCETNPQEAHRINAVGTRNVALACLRCDAVMVYVSTGMVYDGRKDAPYIEFDAVSPVNEYARSKYLGELGIRDILSRFYIFSTCWLFGGGRDDKKFVAKIVERARISRELKAVNDKFGSPTYTADLARGICGFIESGLYGKYHCVNTGCVSRLEMAREIVAAAGIRNCSLVSVPSEEFPLPAPRPRMEAMRNYGFELLGLAPMRGWKEALDEYVASTFA
ncbi:MAG: dTDP-4-dehydrorhamnose reductase, partial [Candidatus Krumholzibacteria bacterium]|nr:dTDP-4-dehydrorhamnose reductase [Candidatus Krumholzibacteria bacterium]